ncbi:MAG: hypothetical protein J1G04_03930 [Clostridiales bacterium]|nr:hypothetical protein [Clostridiales bacterium]
MLYEFQLDESCHTGLTAAERNALIRFCISIGTRAVCATRSIKRPFKQKYLTAAMREMRQNHLRTISEYTEKMENYKEGETKLSDWLIDFFDGVPTKKQFTDYCRSIIKQEHEALRSAKSNYLIPVDFTYTDKKLLAFHNSLGPRVTFGYSSMLHEVCDFALTDEIKGMFLNASLKELPSYKQDWTHDWGYVFFDSIINLIYEDLEVYISERCILSTISHEREMTVSLTEKELTAFIDFESKRNKNIATIEKLKAIN